MAVRLSTGLVNYVMVTGSFKVAFENGTGYVIDIYSGSQPATADTAPTGTKLVTISNNNAGTTVSFASATTSAGVLPKNAGETWTGNGINAGTAGWFRVRKLVDAGTTNTTDVRYDGAVATSGAQMNLASLSVAVSAPVTLSSAIFTLPQTA